jgi:ABC-type amino acid transport system permease subunit
MVAAIVTFGVIASSYLAEIYRGGLAAIHRGQWEACAALGLSGLDAATRVVVPQVFRVVLPTMATYAIGLLKDSALASAIGVAEIAFRANAETQRTGLGLTFFVAAGVLYVGLSLPLAVLSRRLDSRIRARYSIA